MKDPEVHVNPPKRRDCARAINNSAKLKRLLARNWRIDEKHALLVYKLVALKRGKSFTKGTSWSNHVSKILLEKHNFDISPTSCQQEWNTLKKQHVTIQDHDSKIIKGTSSCASYWDMEDDDICELNHKLPPNEKLPRGFYFAWYVLMEEITRASLAAKNTPIIPKTTASLVQELQKTNMTFIDRGYPEIDNSDSLLPIISMSHYPRRILVQELQTSTDGSNRCEFEGDTVGSGDSCSLWVRP